MEDATILGHPAPENVAAVETETKVDEEEKHKTEKISTVAVASDSVEDRVSEAAPCPARPASVCVATDVTTLQSELAEIPTPLLTPAPAPNDPWSSGFGPLPFLGGRSPASVEMLPADSVANWPYPEEEVVCCSETSAPEDSSHIALSSAEVSAADTPPQPQRASSVCSRSSGSGSDASLKCRLSWKKIFALSREGRRGGRGTGRRRGRPRTRSRGRHARDHAPPSPPHVTPLLSSAPLSPTPDDSGNGTGLELGPAKIGVRLGSQKTATQAWKVVDMTGTSANASPVADASPGGTPSVPIVLVRRLVLRCDRSEDSGDGTAPLTLAHQNTAPSSPSSSSTSSSDSEDGSSTTSITPMPSSSEDEDELLAAAERLPDVTSATATRTAAAPVATPGGSWISPASKSPGSPAGDAAPPRTPRILIRRSGGDEYRSFLRGEEARWQPVVVIPRSSVLDQVARKLAARPLSIRLRFASADPIPTPKVPLQMPPHLQRHQHQPLSLPNEQVCEPVCTAVELPRATPVALTVSSASPAISGALTVAVPVGSPPASLVEEAPVAAPISSFPRPSTLAKDGGDDVSDHAKESLQDSRGITKDSLKRDASGDVPSPVKKARRRSTDPADSARARKRAADDSGGDDDGGGLTINAGAVPVKRRCSDPATPRHRSEGASPQTAVVSMDGRGAAAAETCAACGHRFSDAADRATHVRQHRYHCQRCDLAFRSQAEFVAHLSARHPSTRERHHCLLCARSFASAERHAEHVRGRLHRALEGVQRRTVHALFSLLTGRACPGIAPLTASERVALRWLPAEPGAVHFYHQATPLQMAIQDWTRRQQTEVASAPPVPLGESEAL